jgi:hypothetical protein
MSKTVSILFAACFLKWRTQSSSIYTVNPHQYSSPLHKEGRKIATKKIGKLISDGNKQDDISREEFLREHLRSRVVSVDELKKTGAAIRATTYLYTILLEEGA